MIHEIALERRTLHGHFSRDLQPILTIDPGDSIGLMARELGLGRSYALALSSIVVDLRVTQIVNGVKGVHAVLHDGSLRI